MAVSKLSKGKFSIRTLEFWLSTTTRVYDELANDEILIEAHRQGTNEQYSIIYASQNSVTVVGTANTIAILTICKLS